VSPAPRPSHRPPHLLQAAAGTAGSPGGAGSGLLPWSCQDEALLRLAAARDPVGAGLEGVLALRLVQALLAWDPAARPTAEQALQHAYFVWAGRAVGCVGGGSCGGGGVAAAEGGAAAAGAAGGSPAGQAEQPGGPQATEAQLLAECVVLPVTAPGWC